MAERSDRYDYPETAPIQDIVSISFCDQHTRDTDTHEFPSNKRMHFIWFHVQKVDGRGIDGKETFRASFSNVFLTTF